MFVPGSDKGVKTLHEFPLPPSGRSKADAVKQYKEVVRMLARCDRSVKLAGPVAIECVIYRDKRYGPPVAYLPELIAAMQGVFFDRSDQLVELRACLAYDRHRPRVEVAVRAASAATDQTEVLPGAHA